MYSLVGGTSIDPHKIPPTWKRQVEWIIQLFIENVACFCLIIIAYHLSFFSRTSECLWKFLAAASVWRPSEYSLPRLKKDKLIWTSWSSHLKGKPNTVLINIDPWIKSGILQMNPVAFIWIFFIFLSTSHYLTTFWKFVFSGFWVKG